MKSQPITLDPPRLLALLTQQRDYYRQLGALSQRQRSLVSGDRPELLLNLLRERQEVVTALARLNVELGPFRRNWDALYGALPAAERARTAELLHEINGLLRVILRTDQEDGALLAARKQAVAAELAGVTDGQAANAAYAQQAGAAAAPAADVMG